MLYRFFPLASLLLVYYLGIPSYMRSMLSGEEPKTPKDILIPALICLVLFLVLAYVQLQKKIESDFVLQQRDKNIKDATDMLVVLAALSLFQNKGTNDSAVLLYSLIVLFLFASYYLIVKFYIRKYRPETLFINGDQLLYKTSTHTRKRQLSGLKELTYSGKDKAILLRFADGLDNLKIYLSDFSKEDLKRFCQYIADKTGKALAVKDQDLEVILEIQQSIRGNEK